MATSIDRQMESSRSSRGMKWTSSGGPQLAENDADLLTGFGRDAAGHADGPVDPVYWLPSPQTSSLPFDRRSGGASDTSRKAARPSGGPGDAFGEPRHESARSPCRHFLFLICPPPRKTTLKGASPAARRGALAYICRDQQVKPRSAFQPVNSVNL